MHPLRKLLDTVISIAVSCLNIPCTNNSIVFISEHDRYTEVHKRYQECMSNNRKFFFHAFLLKWSSTLLLLQFYGFLSSVHLCLCMHWFLLSCISDVRRNILVLVVHLSILTRWWIHSALFSSVLDVSALRKGTDQWTWQLTLKESFPKTCAHNGLTGSMMWGYS